jgi:hypothetical protein
MLALVGPTAPGASVASDGPANGTLAPYVWLNSRTLKLEATSASSVKGATAVAERGEPGTHNTLAGYMESKAAIELGDETCAVCKPADNTILNCCSEGASWGGTCSGATATHTWLAGYSACNGAPSSIDNVDTISARSVIHEKMAEAHLSKDDLDPRYQKILDEHPVHDRPQDLLAQALQDASFECSLGRRGAAEDQCLAAVQEATHKDGLEVIGFKRVTEGPTGFVPGGCSYSLNSKMAVFNSDAAGANRGGHYRSVCFAPEHTVVPEKDSKGSGAQVPKDAAWVATHPHRAETATDLAKAHPKLAVSKPRIYAPHVPEEKALKPAAAALNNSMLAVPHDTIDTVNNAKSKGSTDRSLNIVARLNALINMCHGNGDCSSTSNSCNSSNPSLHPCTRLAGAEEMQRPARILSYGCANGDEAEVLLGYYRRAAGRDAGCSKPPKVTCSDINTDALKVAGERFTSKKLPIDVTPVDALTGDAYDLLYSNFVLFKEMSADDYGALVEQLLVLSKVVVTVSYTAGGWIPSRFRPEESIGMYQFTKKAAPTATFVVGNVFFAVHWRRGGLTPLSKGNDNARKLFSVPPPEICGADRTELDWASENTACSTEQVDEWTMQNELGRFKSSSPTPSSPAPSSADFQAELNFAHEEAEQIAARLEALKCQLQMQSNASATAPPSNDASKALNPWSKP